MNYGYQHLGENEALLSLQNNAVIKSLLKAYTAFNAEAKGYASVRNRYFLVSNDSNPKLYALFKDAIKKLNVSENVTLYTKYDYSYSAHTIGTDKRPVIILSAKCVEDMSDEQIVAVIGRELAHIQCGHLSYMQIDDMLEPLLRKIPFVGSATVEVAKGLLLSWRKLAEMTADRGGAIVSGSAEHMLTVLQMQMGGNIQEYKNNFLKGLSAEIPPSINSVLAKTILQQTTEHLNTPFAKERIFDVIQWSQSEDCKVSYPKIYENSLPVKHYYTDGEIEKFTRQIEKTVTDDEFSMENIKKKVVTEIGSKNIKDKITSTAAETAEHGRNLLQSIDFSEKKKAMMDKLQINKNKQQSQ